MIRKFKFEQNAYYHICNRSNDQSSIFLDARDYARFLFLILYYQAPLQFYNLGRQISHFTKYSKFKMSDDVINQIVQKRKVGLAGFAIMPNHFHLLLQEKATGGISRYLQRIETGYAKYWNAKYAKQGHLFQGAFRAVPIQTNEQLIYLSAYIHRNPRGLDTYKNKEEKYFWSSYQDYSIKNRWGKLLGPSSVLNQFSNSQSYRTFVETSTAKLKQEEVQGLFLE